MARNRNGGGAQFLGRAKKIFGNECFYCGLPAPSTIDHVIPHSRDGRLTKYNLVPCCERCNQAKGDSILWLEWEPPQGGKVHSMWVNPWPRDYPVNHALLAEWQTQGP